MSSVDGLPIPMLGKRFRRLLVEAAGPPSRAGKRRWLCLCDCGARRLVVGSALRNGTTRSCGCLSREEASTRFRTHGATRTRVYRIWAAMIDRCVREKNQDFAYYGGRGIRVCDRWRNDFAAFLADMGQPPTGHSIDRIDSNGNYEPGNCRWSDKITQGRNRRGVLLSESDAVDIRSLCAFGATRRDLARAFNVNRRTISAVLHNRCWAEAR